MAKGYYNPTSPLDPKFRRSFSEFSYLTDGQIKQGIDNLQQAIENGTVIDVISECKKKFVEIGVTVFMISARKPNESDDRCGIR